VARTTFQLPGTDGPDVTIDRGWTGRPRVFVGDTEIPRSAGTKADYAVNLPDGTTRSFRIGGDWRGQVVIADDGSRLPLERQLSGPTFVVALLPIALVAVGGLIGGLIGGIGAAVNFAIARSALPRSAQVLAMLGVLVVAVVTWFGVAVFIGTRIAEVPQVATGDCLRDIGPGQQLSTDNARPADCEGAHDGEVVGTTDIDGAPGSPYPGEAAMEAVANRDCFSLFAAYVGIPYEQSRLGMYYVGPSQQTWERDDRIIACIALPPEGEQLTGSVRGTAQ
jgi:hypothetical protein